MERGVQGIRTYVTRSVAELRAESKAKLGAAQVEFDQKKKRYEKVTALFRDGAGSPTEVEKAYGEAEIARQNMEAIREELQQHKLLLVQFVQLLL